MLPEVKHFIENLNNSEKVLYIGKPISLPEEDYEKDNYVITAKIDNEEIILSQYFIGEAGEADLADSSLYINLEILQLMYHIFVPGADRSDVRDIISWSGGGTIF